eukprot:CAMPEP_0172466898 /NCGR_PEP_ID=MMETSP1065-20121228/57408_1 /TAXON_ID=265537 /ORGANISM="Amphiprora paludosa, Strain CCMP125" /LENGTH=41 /DNA_ID= /DNA_START= /DNA_END= /DNA_ORIENTATION=
MKQRFPQIGGGAWSPKTTTSDDATEGTGSIPTSTDENRSPS